MDNSSEIPQLQQLRIGEVTSCDLNVNYLLAMGFSDKTVRILEWKLGLGFVDVFYSPLTFHKYAVTSVRFSPKGTLLASASLDGTAVLIDVLTGTKIYTVVQDNTSNVKFCEFTFDSTKLVTAADDGMLCFWDLVHRRQIRHCRLHEEDYSLRAFSVSPDSEYLISMDSGNLLKVWFIGHVLHDQPQCLFLKKDIHDDVLCCEFSPVKNVTGGPRLKLNYCIATCGADCWIKVWEVTVERREDRETHVEVFSCDLRLIHVLKQHSNDVLSVRFNPGGNYMASTGLDSTVILWEVQSGNCLGTLRGHARYVTCAAFSTDSTLLATGSVDKTLIVWDLSRNISLDSELSIPCNVSCHFTNVNVTNYQSETRRTEQQKIYQEFNAFQKLTSPSVINSVLFLGNDVIAMAGGQKTVEIWKREKDSFVQGETQQEHECSVNYLDAIPSAGKVISCSADGMIFWDLNMSLTYRMKTPNGDSAANLKTCKFSPDTRYIVAAGDDQRVYLWDARNLEFLKVTQEYENAVTSIAFTPDGELMVTTCGSDIVLENFEQKKLTAVVNNAHDLGVLCCDFSSAAVSDTRCAYIKLNSSDSSGLYHLATGGNDSLVKLWHVSTADISSSDILPGHGGTVHCVKYSSSEPYILASCSSDTTVRIWDTRSKQCLHVLNYHNSAVTTCSFSRDSTLLATGSLDKSVFILNLTTRHEAGVSTQNCSKLLENWTPSDVANWFLDMGSPELADKIQSRQFGGRQLLGVSEDSIADIFELKSRKEQNQLKAAVLSLKESLAFPSGTSWRGKSVPHKFLCPITHQIMKDPVICTDGYTYDRAAITEWFLSGKLISPITKESLTTTKLLPYSALKINIHKYLHKND